MTERFPVLVAVMLALLWGSAAAEEAEIAGVSFPGEDLSDGHGP